MPANRRRAWLSQMQTADCRGACSGARRRRSYEACYAVTSILTVTSPIQIASGLVDQTLTKGYEDSLPSFNTSWDVMEKLKLRASASRSITRADAGQLLPGTTFTDPSGQIASAGNPDLKPFTSNNIDIGGEFYTGGLGYVGVALFRKNVDVH